MTSIGSDISSSLIEDGSNQPSKRHKKHKHKKHRKRKGESDSVTIDSGKTTFSSDFPVIQLSISSSPNGPLSKTSETKSSLFSPTSISPKNSSKKKKTKGKDSETSSEEERWLDAIESGKLEEVDEELKNIKRKDPKLMTARQRAMLERRGDAVPGTSSEQLLSLPSGYKEKVMTPEMMKKAALKSLKRKQRMDEKREKDKKRTVERLLKKQDTKGSKSSLKKTSKKSELMITLVNNTSEIKILYPSGVDFPMKRQKGPPAPQKITCGVPGCTQLKKYSCSQSLVPLCSLACYKKNLTLLAAA